MHKKSRELLAAIEAAKAGGEILLKYYGKTHVKYKKDYSFVTEADLLSEKKIKSILKKNFPDYSFLGEESGLEEKNSEYVWVIDPLDGTTNYSVMNPFFNVSVALAKEDKPIVGVVYAPIQKELFFAERGCGAYLNNRKISVSEKKDLKTSFIGFCHANDRETTERLIEVFPRLKYATDHVRQVGAGELELSYVAAGRIDAFMMFKQNPWDTASGSLLVEEAGGKVTDFEGRPFNLKSRDLIASNRLLHKKILRLLKN